MHTTDNIQRINDSFYSLTSTFTHGVETAVTNPFTNGKTPVGIISGNFSFGISTYTINTSRSDGRIGLTLYFDTNTTPSFVEYRKTANQSLPHNTNTSISFDNLRFSSGTGITLTSSSRFTVAEAGTYLFTGTVAYTAAAGGVRQIYWIRNGLDAATNTKYGYQQTVPTGLADRVTSSSIMYLGAGEYAEMRGFQNQTVVANLDVLGNQTVECVAMVQKLASSLTPTVTGTLILITS